MTDRNIVPVERMIALRRYPGFADADLAELAVLADNVVETEFVAGAEVARAGRVPAFHLVVEGQLAMQDARWGPRDLAGAVEALAGRVIAAPMIATTHARTLQLSAADFADIVEDNFGLLSDVLRDMARHLLALQRRRGPAPLRVHPANPTTGALGLVDRIVALRRQLPFATGRIQALSALAQATRERTVEAGERIAISGEWAKSSFVILDGVVRVGGRVLGPDDAIGTIEMLGGATYAGDAEALTAGRVLECPAIAVYDVIEDHTDLGLAMIANLAGEAIDRLHDPARGDVN
jgi:CRP-like cAMP-binding protein